MLAYISGLVVVSDMENSEKIKKILPMTIFNLILPTLDIGTDLRLGLAVSNIKDISGFKINYSLIYISFT